MTAYIQRSRNQRDNYSILPNAMFDDDLSWQAKGMLGYLCAKPPDWKVSVQALVNHTQNCVKKTGKDGVYAILKELIQAGYVRRTRSSGEGYATTIYFVSTEREFLSNKSNYTDNKPLTDNPVEDYPVEDETTLQSNNINKVIKKTNGHSDELTENEKFDLFWQHYPRKVSKQGARTSFKVALKKTTFEQLLSAVKAFNSLCKRTGESKRYIKHPTTWLNQGCWEDEDLNPQESVLKPTERVLINGKGFDPETVIDLCAAYYKSLEWKFEDYLGPAPDSPHTKIPLKLINKAKETANVGLK